MVNGNGIFRCLVYLFCRTAQERVRSIPPDPRIRSMQYPAVFTAVQVVLVNLLKKMHVEEVPFSALKVYGRVSFAVKTNSHLTIAKF